MGSSQQPKLSSNEFVFSSESVSEGHPDKVCDQISDAILDGLLAQDPRSRVACETLVKNSMIILAGEITSQATLDYDRVVRSVVRDIGYTNPKVGFDCDSCEVLTFISEQSPDISMGVTEGEGAFKEQGAGDQGIMFGFACNETPELMPLPISLSHHLMIELARIRKSGKVNFLEPDSKSQVSVRYVDGKPKDIHTVVISTQHSEDVDLGKVQEFVVEEVIKNVIPSQYLTKDTRYLINPTGRFVVGGPVGDCGLTGRKIIVDTYGGYSRHGGGAFSGKDPSKVDRSAAYAARHIAKNVVAAGLADKCEVQLAYAIGVAQPVSIHVETFGTGKVSDNKIVNAIDQVFDLRPQSIIQNLELLKPIYKRTAAYGHFGRESDEQGHFSWERLDKAEQLKSAV
ncbi:MAG: methionine adenosyltransferase [Deltaproteobacteria bacterium]|nr:methionine adenosyltransferase [Deltaproteobacteria bacterium]